MEIYFTSDTHLAHNNIRKYCNRPFATVEEMDEAIISRWNELVRPCDRVYHLGDFAFTKSVADTEKYIKRLHGQIHLIRGNHDKHNVRRATGFAWQGDILRLKGFEQDIIMCHFAMRVWDKSHFGSFHLYGHSHGTLHDDPNALSMDVGVDANEFRPLSWYQIKEHMAKKNFVPVVRRKCEDTSDDSSED